MIDRLQPPRITRIVPDSIAAEIGFEVGDRLVSINGEKPRDLIDYRFLIADEFLELVAVVEVVPDGALENPFSLGPVGGLAEVNDQFERSLEVVFLGPADDKFLGLGVQVALMKGGGIDGIEDLLKVLNLDLDELMA